MRSAEFNSGTNKSPNVASNMQEAITKSGGAHTPLSKYENKLRKSGASSGTILNKQLNLWTVYVKSLRQRRTSPWFVTFRAAADAILSYTATGQPSAFGLLWGQRL